MPLRNNIVVADPEKAGYGVSVADVASVLGVASGDVKTLCLSTNINKWSKFKPTIPHSGTSVSDHPTPVTAQELADAAYGLVPAQAFTALGDGSGRYRLSADREWGYTRPGTGYFGRLTDFVATRESDASNVGVYGYNPAARPPVCLLLEERLSADTPVRCGKTVTDDGTEVWAHTLNLYADPQMSSFALYASYRFASNSVRGYGDTGLMDFSVEDLGLGGIDGGSYWGLAMVEYDSSAEAWIYTGYCVLAAAKLGAGYDGGDSYAVTGGLLRARTSVTVGAVSLDLPWEPFYELSQDFTKTRYAVPVLIKGAGAPSPSHIVNVDGQAAYVRMGIDVGNLYGFPEMPLLSFRCESRGTAESGLSASVVQGAERVTWEQDGTQRGYTLCGSSGAAVKAAWAAYDNASDDASFMAWAGGGFVDRRATDNTYYRLTNIIVALTAKAEVKVTPSSVAERVKALLTVAAGGTALSTAGVETVNMVPWGGADSDFNDRQAAFNNGGYTMSEGATATFAMSVLIAKSTFLSAFGGDGSENSGAEDTHDTGNETIWTPYRGGHYDIRTRSLSVASLPAVWLV